MIRFHRKAALAVLIGLCALTPTASALTAREIMQKVEDRDDGDNAVQDMEMILIDKKGKQRVRAIRSFSRDVGEDTHSIMFFLDPADVKDTGFFTLDYDDAERDDDQWLYLPALKKTKRIASTDKSSSFMGSDFNYSDMSSRELERYDFELMKETEVRGHKVWQIQSIPRTKDEIERTGYLKSVFFIRQDNFVVIRSVGWLEKGRRLRYMDTKALAQMDGIWVAPEVHMTTKKGKKTLHKTVLKNHGTKFNQELDDQLFSLRRLEKGI